MPICSVSEGLTSHQLLTCWWVGQSPSLALVAPLRTAGNGVMSTSAFDGIITVDGLTKRFDSRAVVDRLTFQVHPGQVTGFLGPNGAGKSTTMKILLGLMAATRGSARVAGQDFRTLRNPGQMVGAMLEPVQSPRTGREHLLWMAAAAGVPERLVAQKLELVGLGDAANQRVSRYSLGMRQRLAVAGALLAEPQVLILDEPINGLDPEGILWLRDLLRDLAAEGRTVFLSSHLMSEMEKTAERVIIINKGHLVEDVSVSELTVRAAGDVVEVSGDDDARLAAALSERGAKVRSVADTDEPRLEVIGLEPLAIGRVARDLGIALSSLSRERASLETAFLQATAGKEGGILPTASHPDSKER